MHRDTYTEDNDSSVQNSCIILHNNNNKRQILATKKREEKKNPQMFLHGAGLVPRLHLSCCFMFEKALGTPGYVARRAPIGPPLCAAAT